MAAWPLMSPLASLRSPPITLMMTHTPPLMAASPSPMARLHHAHANGNEARDTNEVAAGGPNHSTAQLWLSESSVTGWYVDYLARGA